MSSSPIEEGRGDGSCWWREREKHDMVFSSTILVLEKDQTVAREMTAKHLIF